MTAAAPDNAAADLSPVAVARRSRAVVAATLVAGVAGGVLAAVLVMGVVGTQFFGYRVLTVRSGSMAPAFRQGDFLVIKPADPVGLKEGDPVVFRVAGEALVLHRIVAVTRVELNISDSRSGDVSRSTSLQFRTKGDASQVVDAMPVDGTAVVGVPWFRVPGAGEFGGLSLREVLLGVAALSAVAWLLWEVRCRFGRHRGIGGELT